MTIDYYSLFSSTYFCVPTSSRISFSYKIGHNLNYGHSSKNGIEYADRIGLMGLSDELDDGPSKCFNAAKR